MSPFNKSMSADSDSVSHLTSEELAAYLDGRLDSAVVARLESHMAQCRDCRGEMVAARATLESAKTISRRPLAAHVTRRRAWLIAASVLVVASIPVLQRGLRSRADAIRERATTRTSSHIEVVAPEGQPVSAESVTFTWRRVAQESICRLTVTDPSGTALFTLSTPDTVASSSGRNLQPGRSYLWYVDCLTSDGRSLSSGIRTFSTSR